MHINLVLVALLVLVLIVVVALLIRSRSAKRASRRSGANTIAPTLVARPDPRVDFPETVFERGEAATNAAQNAMRKRPAPAPAPAVPRKREEAVTDPLERPRSLAPSSGRDAVRDAEAKAVKQATLGLLDSGIEVPPVGPPPADFDAHETQVFMRPTPASAPAAPRKREGAAPVVLTGPRLVGLSGSRKGSSFPVAAAGITVGRHPTCDIVLGDARVSGRHAWIGIVEGKALLRDLRSTNGTFLNAQTQASVSETELRTGDTIFFGGHQGDQFRFVAD
jgi:hypothetical protein